MVEWGNRCYHCGSENHTRNECKEFQTLMEKSTVGKPKAQWKPPPGYKSAIGKARDALKEAEKRKAGKVGSFRGDDTASEASEFSDGEGVPSFAIKSMRPVAAIAETSDAEDGRDRSRSRERREQEELQAHRLLFQGLDSLSRSMAFNARIWNVREKSLPSHELKLKGIASARCTPSCRP